MPIAIAIVSGNDQTGEVGARLAELLVVQVTAADGLGVAGVTVDFTTSEQGLFEPVSVVTDADGMASTSWTLGPTEGLQTAVASVNGLAGANATFTASVAALPLEGTWTWISGNSSIGQAGVYGTQGTASPSNVPGARYSAVSWADAAGNMWLFGGSGIDATASQGILNDLWRFDGSNWTWVSGSTSYDQWGVYGTQGVASAANVPGGRHASVSWIDAAGDLWLFGGRGYDAAGTLGYLNDLWRFDGANWTWVSGSSSANQPGVYGTQGTASPSNVPGGRHYFVSWIDAAGHFWIFGGVGYDATGRGDRLNDLWRFDGTNWTWVSGSTSVEQPGVYGTKGLASPSNVPGARYACVSWIDAAGNLRLFGGYGYDGDGSISHLNDLWRFDGTNWTWVSGSSSIEQWGVYGTQGTASPSNVPGARGSSISWVDSAGDLWLFGGSTYDAAGSFGRVNDLWRYRIP